MDFFDPENEETPRHLPVCTKWFRDPDKLNTLCMLEVKEEVTITPTLLSDDTENQSNKDFPGNAEPESQ